MASNVTVSLADVLSRYQLTEQQLNIPCPQEHSDEVARELVTWELLAYSLGLTDGEVKAIEQNNLRDYALQRLKSLRTWRQKMGERASYLHLARGLEKEGRMDLVGTLCELLVASLVSPAALADTPLAEQVAMFEERFECLVRDTFKQLKKDITVEDLQFDLTLLPSAIKDDHISYIESNIDKLHEAKDLKEIFLYLNLYWDYINYTLLEMIVNKYGSGDLKQRMEMYILDLTEFLKKTTVAEYILICRDKQKFSQVPKELVELKSKLLKPAKLCTLFEMEKLRRDLCTLLSMPKFAMILFNLEDTSVTVTWLIHKTLLPLFDTPLESVVKLSPTIDYISVDEKCVYGKLKFLQSPSKKEMIRVKQPEHYLVQASPKRKKYKQPITRRAFGQLNNILKKRNFKKVVGLGESERTQVFLGGSVGQGTALPGHHDLDLVLYLPSIDFRAVPRDGYEELLGKIKEYLKQELSSDYLDNPDKTSKVAVQFTYLYHGVELDVDLLLSPHWDTKQDYWRDLQDVSPPKHKYKTFSSGASKFQTAFIKKQHQRVKIAIKRAKDWRNESWKGDEAGRPKSYLISLLVINAYHRAAGSTRKIKQLKLKKIVPKVNQELKDLVKGIATGTIPSLDLREPGDKENIPSLELPSLPRIIDPANPFNNLYLSGLGPRNKGKKEKKPLSEIKKEKQEMWEIFRQKITKINITKPGYWEAPPYARKTELLEYQQ